jgi:zinc/manganese transport system substrate-binding protein
MSGMQRKLFAVAALAGGWAVASPAWPAELVKVIASFSILGDLAAKVGGGRVEVTTLVGPNGDGHVYEPTPADARQTASADLVVVNGLGFEGWLERLVEASGYSGPVAIASEGVTPLKMDAETEAEQHGHAEEPGHEAGRHHGNVDPHAWQSVANAGIYVSNIAEALCAVDAAGCAEFQANAAAYGATLKSLDEEISRKFSAIPVERRTLVTSHDALGYFSGAYGVRVLAPQGVSTESEASAADVAKLIRQIRAEGVSALFVENISDPRLIEQISRETGVRPGGALYSDALSEAGGPAATYVEMMRHNAALILAVMQGS